MEKALRNEDGSMISHASWDVIKVSAKTAIGIYLRKLKVDQPSKKYFRVHHTKEWNNAIAFLEVARPLVGLCAGHWKAEHVLSAVITGERTSMKRAAEKKAQKKSPHDSDGEDFGKGVFGDGNDTDNDNDNDNTDFKGKKRSAPLPTTKAKRTKVQRETKAAKVKELPTNTKSETQRQMKSLATETEAQRPVAQLEKAAPSKPLLVIFISYLNQRYQLHLLKAR
jgi:hypothetical protein